MMSNYFNSSYGHGMPFGFSGGFIFLLLAWSFVWKGLALWKAARDGRRNWFVALLVINTLGILEILYLYVFSKGDAKPVKDDKKA